MILKFVLLFIIIILSTISGGMIGYRIQNKEKQGLLEFSITIMLTIPISIFTVLEMSGR